MKSERSRLYQGLKQYPVQHICLHTSDTPSTWMPSAPAKEKVAEIRRWHTTPRPKGNGWNDIGYHWVIDRNGTIQEGRKETTIGAGVMGFNAGVIHICLIGGKGGKAHDRLPQHYTLAQESSLLELIAAIQKRTPIKTITGHNQHAARECPCFNVPKWVESRGGLASVLAGRSK